MIVEFPIIMMRTRVRRVIAAYADLTAEQDIELSRKLAELVEQMDLRERGKRDV